MKYVSIAGIMRDVTAGVNTKLLPDLKTYDENITGVYFRHGHFLEIRKVLEQISKSESKSEQFPLIGLFRDFPEQEGQTVGIYSEPNIKLIIATRTQPNWTADQREERSFIPILYPIYFEMLRQFTLDKRIMGYNESTPRTRTDHYFWGNNTLFEKTANIFNEFTDSIEVDIKLKINLKNC